jgi:hypothetical protein
MIESDKTFGTFEIYCDACDEYATYDTDGNFNEFINEAKSDGWLSRKEKDMWMHYCPVCKEGL